MPTWLKQKIIKLDDFDDFIQQFNTIQSKQMCRISWFFLEIY